MNIPGSTDEANEGRAHGRTARDGLRIESEESGANRGKQSGWPTTRAQGAPGFRPGWHPS